MKKKTIYILFFSIITILLASFLYSFNNNNKEHVSEQKQEKALSQYTPYYSDFLRIKFLYPNYLKVNEIDNSIFLENKTGDRFIVDRVGSDYETLDEHLNALEHYNKIRYIDRQKLKINNIDSIRTTIKDQPNKNQSTYFYFFYPTKWRVFSISTDSIKLLPELEKIANSFQYIP